MCQISVLTPTIRGDKALQPVMESLKQQTFKDFEWLIEYGDGKTHDLNAAFNKMLKRAYGELIVFYEDYTKIRPDGLQKFWDAYQNDKNTFFTAPVGKTLNWKKVDWDWRITPENKADWMSWEIDWGAAPLEALKKIGGFDEALDKYWTFDNVNVGFRANLAGYKFKNLYDNPAIALDHDKLMSHPFRQNWNPDFHNERLDQFRHGLKINYL